MVSPSTVSCSCSLVRQYPEHEISAANSPPSYAVPEGPLKIENSIAMIQKRLSIRGWPSGTAKDSEDTVAFALDQGVECQIETFSLKDADKAYEQ